MPPQLHPTWHVPPCHHPTHQPTHQPTNISANPSPGDALVHHLLPFCQLSRANLSSSSCLCSESIWDLGTCWLWKTSASSMLIFYQYTINILFQNSLPYELASSRSGREPNQKLLIGKGVLPCGGSIGNVVIYHMYPGNWLGPGYPMGIPWGPFLARFVRPPRHFGRQKIGMAEKPQTQTGISSVHHNLYLIYI